MAILRQLITMLGFKIDDKKLQEYEKMLGGTKKKAEGLSKSINGMGTAIKLIGGFFLRGVVSMCIQDKRQ